jgi:hypothetical protein
MGIAHITCPVSRSLISLPGVNEGRLRVEFDLIRTTGMSRQQKGGYMRPIRTVYSSSSASTR